MSVEPFTVPGQCLMPDCEVTLKFDDKSCLYVCKHALVNRGEYFRAMFCGEFTEKYKSDVELHDVSRSDMLLFLKFTVPLGKYGDPPKICNVSELCALISLADRFLYPQLCQEIADRLLKWVRSGSWSPPTTDPEPLCELIALEDRLLSCGLNDLFVTHILYKPAIYRKSAEFKLALVEAAYMHRGSSTLILETCVRLCASLELEDLEQLKGKPLGGTVTAISMLITKALPIKTSKRRSPPSHVESKEGGVRETKRYDSLEFSTNEKRWLWKCNTCDQTQEAILRFSDIMNLKIDKSLLA